MAKNISLLGADYPDVPAVQLPMTGGGTATFYDINVIDNLNSDSSTDALSARQGKVLKTKFDDTIPENADLNSYINNCIMRSPSTMSGVSTLSNCPSDTPFTLIVTGFNQIGACIQTILTDGSIFTRRGTSQGFGKWFKFTGTIIN